MNPKKMILLIFVIVSLATAVAAADANITNPDHDSTIDFSSQDLTLDWKSIQDHSSSDSLIESTLTVDDGSNNVELTIDRSDESSVSQGDSVSESYSFSDSELDNLEDGFWSISVSDKWEESSDGSNFIGSDSITINAENTGSGGSDASFGISIDSPGSTYEHNPGDDLSVQWTSEIDGGEAELQDATILVEGDQGGSYETTVDIGEWYSSDSTHSTTIDGSNIDFSSGDWYIEVTDNWGSGQASASRFFEAGSTSDDSGGDGGADQIEDDDDSDTGGNESDGSEDDGGVVIDDGNDGDDSTDDSTDNSTDDSTDDSTDNSTDDSTDDSTDNSTDDSSNSDGSTNDSDDGDSEDSNNCPDGFTYDSENDVCLEDSGDSSDSNSDSGDSNGGDGDTSGSTSDESSTDDQNSDGINGENEDSNTSMLQQEVVAGISVQTMLLGLFAVLTLGLLFKRSSYTLKF